MEVPPCFYTDKYYLISGGYDEDRNHLDSTELWDGERWSSHDPLPETLHSHCLVRLNNTHVFLTGGHSSRYNGYSRASYFYSKATGFQRAPDMRGRRRHHRCGLHDGRYVIVAGGSGDVFVAGGGDLYEDVWITSSSSECFDLETGTWYKGPSVDTFDFGQHLVSWGSHTYCIGWKKIWEFVKTGHVWEWVEVAEMETQRQHETFQAFLVSAQDCQDWQ